MHMPDVHQMAGITGCTDSLLPRCDGRSTNLNLSSRRCLVRGLLLKLGSACGTRNSL
jgi:hypothetical protein